MRRAHVLHIDDAVAQVAVGHARELLDVLLDHVLECRLGREPLRDGGLHLGEKAAVLEHEAVRVHDGRVELRKALRQPLLQALHLDTRLRDGAAEAAPLVVLVVGARVLDEREADRGLEEVGLSAPESGRRGQPAQAAAHLAAGWAPRAGPPSRTPGVA
jgi:hypothetical protein